jgi:hypothetical protein
MTDYRWVGSSKDEYKRQIVQSMRMDSQDYLFQSVSMESRGKGLFEGGVEVKESLDVSVNGLVGAKVNMLEEFSGRRSIFRGFIEITGEGAEVSASGGLLTQTFPL